MEAISLNKPIVTLPGFYMRSKFAYAVLKFINLEEIIPSSKNEYVKVAVKLAKNKKYREYIINKIKKNKMQLFNDKRVIKFLEKIIKDKMLNLKER